MPYTAEHRARTRARIIESARRLFNRHGFEQIGARGGMNYNGPECGFAGCRDHGHGEGRTRDRRERGDILAEERV